MSGEVRYLSRADVEAVGLPMSAVLAAVEDAFREKGEGRVEMPPKIGIHPAPPDFLHAMPAYVPAARAAGIKWVGSFPANPERGLPTISGLLILNDPATGLPVAVMDCTWITAQRTGAASAVAAKYLARREPGRLAIIGCGVQGRSHLEAMLAQFPGLQRVTVHDRRPDAAARYAEEMGGRCGRPITVAPTCEAAVRGADIIVTATEIRKPPEPVIRAEWLQPGAFCMPVDFDAQFTPEAIRAMDLLVTDDLAQFEHYRRLGYFQSTPPVGVDLGAVVAGRRPGRAGSAQRIMCLNLGLAVADMVTAASIVEQAARRGIGMRLPL